jgi:hypothetical protein
MRLTGEEIEQAFVQTASEQVNGQSFNWERVAVLLNERLADNLLGREHHPRPFVLGGGQRR